MKTLRTITCVAALTAMTAFGQKSPAPSAAAQSTGSEATGKIVEFISGTSISLNTGAGEPSRYKLGKGVTYLNARGKVVKAGKMKKDRKVKVHYAKEGNDMVADKVTVVKD